MTDKELRKLSRVDLLEMLIAQSAELQACKEKLEAAEAALKNRDIALNKAGSIAEASLLLSGIFDAAQLACQQYTDNIRQLSERQESVCAKLEADSLARAQQIIADAEQKRQEMECQTEAECAAMLEKAKAESQRYWDDVSTKLQAFYDAHAGLRQLMDMVMPLKKQE